MNSLTKKQLNYILDLLDNNIFLLEKFNKEDLKIVIQDLCLIRQIIEKDAEKTGTKES